MPSNKKLDKIEMTCAECAQYNEIYGTHLSYGYYVAFLENRRLAPEWLNKIAEKRKRERDEEFERMCRANNEKQKNLF